MSSISIATPFNIDLEFNASPVLKRGLAYIIDGVILWVYELAYSYVVMPHLPENEGWQQFILLFTLFLPIALYHFLMETFFSGQSIGKKIVGIRVVNINGGKAGISQYFIRLLFRSYLIVPLASSVIVMIFASGVEITQDNWPAFLAAFAILFALGMLGMFLYYILSKYGQRLGDKLANTLVIEDKAKADFHQTIYLEIADTAYKVRYPEVMRLTDRDINGIRNLIDVKRLTRDNEAYMARIALRITSVLGITTDQEPYDFLAQLLRDYNFLTSK